MDKSQLFVLAFNALTERKTRTILTILMVIVGSSLIVVLNGLSAGQTQFVSDQLNKLGADVIIVSSGQRSFRGEGDASSSIILNSVVASKINSLPYVKEVVPIYSGSIQISSVGNTVSASVLSMNPEKLYIMLPQLALVDGSVIKPYDQSAMLVGYNVASPPGSTSALINVGQTVKASFSYVGDDGKQQKETRSFIVSGVIQQSGSNQVDRAIVINSDAGNSLLRKSSKFSSLMVQAQSTDLVATVQQEITDTYGTTIGVSTAQSSLALRASFTSGINSFILSVGMIALVVGAVGIITTLYTSVTERIREIGTMKAIGAQSSTILSLFLVEALLIGVLGSTLGLVVGVVAGYSFGSSLGTGLPGASSIPPIYLPADLLNVWLISTGLSVVAGILPALKASKLPPIVALRRE
ncbi:MAG: FtsX-like permease family protein [Nitrosarchaeum sp.]|nr:FtsX-like permease family protein [Nitrosarchaeum sp.]